MTPATSAETFLRRLKELGADYLFTNPGPESAVFSEVYQRIPAEELPKPMIVPHEALAVSMAHGYYLATGRPQAVLAQFSTGVAASLVQLIGAARMNVPLMFVTGRPPAASRDRAVHWSHDSFDQSAMSREYMKWEGDIRRPQMTAEVLSRGWEIMASSPPGPVSVMVARDILGESAGESPVMPVNAIPAPVPDTATIARIRSSLLESSRPLVITSRSGMNPRTVDLLEKFAERYQVGVLCPLAQAVNIRTSHPCFLGFSDDQVLKEADLILVLDTEVPWIPERQVPSENARVIHVGPDPLFGGIPARRFRSDLNVEAGVEATLEALLEIAPSERAPSAWVTANREALQTARLQAPMAKFNPSAVAEVLSLSLNENVVLINESSLPPEFLSLEHAGTYFRSASVLGWSIGCALGFKLGRPESLPLAVVGDGAYYLSHSSAAAWVSLNRKLPIVTIVLNDSSSSQSVQRQFSSLSPALPLAAMATAVGGMGYTATTRPELKAALDEALAAAVNGRSCLIDARI